MDNNLNNTNKHTHKIMLNNRRTCMIVGVIDVLKFDEKEVVLETDQGLLTLRGVGLHVGRLTLEKGEMDIDGQVDSMTYSEVNSYGKKAESVLSRMFK